MKNHSWLKFSLGLVGLGSMFYAWRRKKLDRIEENRRVDEASDDSFPASDPPSWTGSEI